MSSCCERVCGGDGSGGHWSGALAAAESAAGASVADAVGDAAAESVRRGSIPTSASSAALLKPLRPARCCLRCWHDQWITPAPINDPKLMHLVFNIVGYVLRN